MRLLFIDSRCPLVGCGVLNGSRQRSILLSRAASAVADLDLLVIRPDGAPAEMAPEQRVDVSPFRKVQELRYEARTRLWADSFPEAIAERLRLLFWNPHKLRLRTDETIRVWLRQAVERERYDAILVRYLHNAVISGAFEAGPPVVLDVDDLDYEHAKNEISMPYNSRASRFLLRRYLPWLRRKAENYYRLCEALFTCKEADRAFPGLGGAAVLPNIPFHLLRGPSPCLPDAGAAKTVIFVGDMEWGPSTVAAASLVQVWSDIRRRVPNARLRLVGRHESALDAVSWRRVPGVELTGYVESIRAEYERGTIFVAPIKHGSGTSIKVLEGASYARTGVVTPHAIRGAEHVLRDRAEVLVAGSQEQLVSSICELLMDDSLRKQLAMNAWQSINRHFSFEAFARIVCNVIRTVGR